MNKIYTKTGDKGKTSLLGGTRVKKSDSRLDAYGTIDELNAYIGLMRSRNVDVVSGEFLAKIQNVFFVMGTLLANEKGEMIEKLPKLPLGFEKEIEDHIDAMNAVLPELKNFILPGGSELAAVTHVARTVCRKAERIIVSLGEVVDVDANIIILCNRISDYLFVLSRYYNHLEKVEEVIWKA